MRICCLHKTHRHLHIVGADLRLPALVTQAADQPSGGSPPVVLTGEPATIAAGAARDYAEGLPRQNSHGW